MVETETSNFVKNHTGIGSIVSDKDITIEALAYGLKITQPGRVGFLIWWPSKWPTSAEILLPTKIISPHLEAENPPCGYIRDFGDYEGDST